MVIVAGVPAVPVIKVKSNKPCGKLYPVGGGELGDLALPLTGMNPALFVRSTTHPLVAATVEEPLPVPGAVFCSGAVQLAVVPLP